MTAVEPVLMFRASCHCGWWRVTGCDEFAALTAIVGHTVNTRCDGCTDPIEHDDSVVHEQGSWAGLFCPECAFYYAPEAA
jgi:hypothetical protein